MKYRLFTMCLVISLSAMACKHAGSASRAKDIEGNFPDGGAGGNGGDSLADLDTECRIPAPLGTYLNNPKYAQVYRMPRYESEITDFCRRSVGECNASSKVYGRAVCEDGTRIKHLCAAEDGEHPVICYPAIDP